MDRIMKLLDFLAASPNDSFLKHALALEYIKAGDDVTARQLFEEILQNEPGYIGSYYHLAKLLERAGDFPNAMAIYEKGMEQARNAKDQHSYNELQAALEDL